MMKPNLTKKYRIVVVRGGRSNEREISLLTGENVEKALRSRGHQAVGMDVNDKFFLSLLKKEFDVVFIALHGKWGEDGTLQGMLEMMDIPYTGSGVLASALAMDKTMAKKVFENQGIPTPKWRELGIKQGQVPLTIVNGTCPQQDALPFPLPFVVKPANGGSTLGISLVRTPQEYEPALVSAYQADSRVFVEEYIEGREMTVGILGKRDESIALPVVEIKLKVFFDYENKYTTGRAEHLIPAPLEKEVTQQVQGVALKAHQALGCSGFSRVDVRLNAKNQAYVLDVNTIPGMTELSLFPDAAKAAGISFEDVAELLIQWALEP